MSLKYKKLVVWQRADDLFIEVHRLTHERFPSFERYELGSQLRRAAYSVRANVVEGSARATGRDKDQILQHRFRFAERADLWNSCGVSTWLYRSTDVPATGGTHPHGGGTIERPHSQRAARIDRKGKRLDCHVGAANYRGARVNDRKAAPEGPPPFLARARSARVLPREARSYWF